MTLGDLGADVIKVERPGDGDESRGWGPPFDANGESAYFICCNRNKLSIALDLDSESDRLVLGGLIRGASVVLDNFRPGTLERKGIDPLSMLTECHSLVWCTLTGFGLGSTRPGYDYVVQAEAGWMSITGPEQGPPMKVGVALADVISGKDAVIGVLAALHAVSTGPRSPDQRRITVSLSGSAKAALVNVAQNYLVSGSEPKRWGNAHPNLVPYQLFQAADRGLVVAVGNDGQWRQCCAALELPDLGADAALATNSGRLANRQRVIDAISARLVERRAGEWQAVLDRVGVPCGVVRSVPEALGGAEASALTGIAPSVPGSVRLPPPRLDEHGALIRAHGWGAFERVERLGPSRHAT
jgi:crotonobetainyl-CoA:carnitine CoA-transferase CaiB-like acyl-CoA transferase